MTKSTNEMVKDILAGANVREVIAESAAGPDEMSEAIKVVVRNGKKVRKQIKKKTKKRILTPDQKKAIKKAQKASKTATARNKRKKSLKVARTLEGIRLGEEMELGEVGIICPACGSNAVVIQHDEENAATTFFCPDCESEFVLCNVDDLEDEDFDDEAEEEDGAEGDDLEAHYDEEDPEEEDTSEYFSDEDPDEAE